MKWPPEWIERLTPARRRRRRVVALCVSLLLALITVVPAIDLACRTYLQCDTPSSSWEGGTHYSVQVLTTSYAEGAHRCP